MKNGLALIMMAVILSVALISVVSSEGSDTRVTESSFDMKGTITNVLSPSSIVIGKDVVSLQGVDASRLYRSTYLYLMDDLKSYYIGKDVFVKGNYTYFDLQGSYNSESINEMIQKEISELLIEQDFGRLEGWYFDRPYRPYFTGYLS